jgi:hypothetical protein
MESLTTGEALKREIECRANLALKEGLSVAMSVRKTRTL